MDILIIGPKKRKKTDLELMRRAKNYFEKVLYAPITRIGIESGESGVTPFLKNKNLLSFDVVLVRAEKEHRDIGYVLAKIFEDNGKYLPVNYKAIMLGSSEFLVPVYFGLKKNGIRAPKTFYASSKQAIIRNFGSINYPITVKLPYQKDGAMIVDSKESAIGVMDTMEKLDQPILIQETAKNSEKIRILVAGNKVYALKNDLPHELSQVDTKNVLETAKTMGAQICQLYAVAQKGHLSVTGVNIAPRMMIFESNFNGGVIDGALKEIRAEADLHFAANKTNL